jgi:hypothetical protein
LKKDEQQHGGEQNRSEPQGALDDMPYRPWLR